MCAYMRASIHACMFMLAPGLSQSADPHFCSPGGPIGDHFLPYYLLKCSRTIGMQ